MLRRILNFAILLTVARSVGAHPAQGDKSRGVTPLKQQQEKLPCEGVMLVEGSLPTAEIVLFAESHDLREQTTVPCMNAIIAEKVKKGVKHRVYGEGYPEKVGINGRVDCDDIGIPLAKGRECYTWDSAEGMAQSLNSDYLAILDLPHFMNEFEEGYKSLGFSAVKTDEALKRTSNEVTISPFEKYACDYVLKRRSTGLSYEEIFTKQKKSPKKPTPSQRKMFMEGQRQRNKSLFDAMSKTDSTFSVFVGGVAHFSTAVRDGDSYALNKLRKREKGNKFVLFATKSSEMPIKFEKRNDRVKPEF